MTAPSRTEQPTLHDVLGAPLPPAPAYGSNSIADALESASSLVAQRSLARPAHALDADPAFNSVADPLNLAGRLVEQDVDPASFRHTCVVMVDGLGPHRARTALPVTRCATRRAMGEQDRS